MNLHICNVIDDVLFLFLLHLPASNIYSSDEEGSDFEMTRSKKNFKGKVLKDSDDSNVSSESASGSGGEADEAVEADSD